MRIYLFLGRIAKVYGAMVLGVAAVLAVLAAAIGVDTWVINCSGPRVAEGIHLRFYVLPVCGGLLAAIIVWQRVIPAGHEMCLVYLHEMDGSSFRAALRTAAWIFFAAAVFLAASLVQRAIFGFFLPS